MNNEKMVVQSPSSLNVGEDNAKRFYLIAAGCGLGLGVVLSLVGGVVNIFAWLFFALLTTLIGWGFRNKQMKYKCFGLRNMRFLVDEKPPYPELYQKLLPVLSSVNMKTELNKDGILCILCEGIYYDVVFNEDDSFSIHWHQSFARAFLRQGYYIGLYKKVLTAMGIIAYRVQKICLYDDEVYYESVDSVEMTDINPMQVLKKKENPKRNIFLIIAVSIVVGLIGFYLMISVLGTVAGAFYAAIYGADAYLSEDYASVIEDYACDIGGYSKEDVYALIHNCAVDYYENGTVNFVNMKNWKAGLRFNEYMRYNEDYIGTGMVLEGEITAKGGNIIEIYDTPSFDEYVQIGESGYTGTNVDIYYGADISLTGKTSDEFYEGDQVRVIGVYCGKIRLENGEYTPAIVAIDMYTTNSYY